MFDPGINALSIVTKILPEPIFVEQATIEVPANKATPIAAQDPLQARRWRAKADLSADFDWRQNGRADLGNRDRHARRHGAQSQEGRKQFLTSTARLIMQAPLEEYEMIYARFAELLKSGKSDADVTPLQLVCDCFMLGRPVTTAEFV